MITPTRKFVFLTSNILLLGVAVLFSDSCSKTSKAEADAAKAPDAPTVAVAKATVEDLSHGLVLTAEFKPYQEVDLMAKVAGYVKKINVDVGDRVQRRAGTGDSRDPGNGGRPGRSAGSYGSQPGGGGARSGPGPAGRIRA